MEEPILPYTENKEAGGSIEPRPKLSSTKKKQKGKPTTRLLAGGEAHDDDEVILGKRSRGASIIIVNKSCRKGDLLGEIQEEESRERSASCPVAPTLDLLALHSDRGPSLKKECKAKKKRSIIGNDNSLLCGRRRKEESLKEQLSEEIIISGNSNSREECSGEEILIASENGSGGGREEDKRMAKKGPPPSTLKAKALEGRSRAATAVEQIMDKMYELGSLAHQRRKTTVERIMGSFWHEEDKSKALNQQSLKELSNELLHAAREGSNNNSRELPVKAMKVLGMVNVVGSNTNPSNHATVPLKALKVFGLPDHQPTLFKEESSSSDDVPAMVLLEAPAKEKPSSVI